jgi:2-polyprenyl-6-methoxyphenol hydroxylase-like FAD-dependent oxidoreductase
VLGAGVAGLVTAAALSGSIDEVLLVDRDGRPAEGLPRRGVPQARHVHALLAGGAGAMDQLLPGFADDLVAAGAPAGDLGTAVRMRTAGGPLCPAPSGRRVVSASRVLIEDVLRRRVLDLPGVELVPAADAVGLQVDDGSVTGARVVTRGPAAAGRTLPADLVVDATGRGSRLGHWLAATGHEGLRWESLLLDLRYASIELGLPQDALGPLLASVVAPSPGRPRGASLSRIENGRWLLTLLGMCGHDPGKDRDAMLRFARTLPAPEIAGALAAGGEGAPLARFHFPSARRCRLDPSRLPSGLLVVGDALVSLDPIYAQGMSVAALQAVAVRDDLARRGRLPSRHRTQRLQREVSHRAGGAWTSSTGADLALPEVPGHRSPVQRLLIGWMGRVQRCATRDPKVAARFLEVMSLLRPPSSLLLGATAGRVVLHGGRWHTPVQMRPGERAQVHRLAVAYLLLPVSAVVTVATAAAGGALLRRRRRAPAALRVSGGCPAPRRRRGGGTPAEVDRGPGWPPPAPGARSGGRGRRRPGP